MEIKANIETYRLLALLDVVSVDLSGLKILKPRFTIRRGFKRLRFKSDILYFKWGEFIKLNEYVNDYRLIIHYLNELSGYNNIHLLPAWFTYTLWLHYAENHNKVLKALDNINSEIKVKNKKNAKDMGVFGLLNITDFIAKATNMKHKEVEDQPIHWILAMYKMEVYKYINMQKQYEI